MKNSDITRLKMMRDGHYLELTFANHLPEENLLRKNRELLFFIVKFVKFL